MASTIVPQEMKIAVEARLEMTGGRPDMYMRAMMPAVWMNSANSVATSAPRRSGTPQNSHETQPMTNAVRYSTMHCVNGSNALNHASKSAFFDGGTLSRSCVA